jgi:hypothetical protein
MSGDVRVVTAHLREIVARHVEVVVGVDGSVGVEHAADAGMEGVSEAVATDLAALDNQMHRG